MLVLALAWSALLASSQSVPTIAALEGLPPEAVGEVVLAGRDHSRIEAVEIPVPDFAPPGVVQLHLVEQASRQLGGCVRRRWTAAFHPPTPESPKSAAVLRRAYSVTEVALPSEAGCSGAEFASLNSGLPVEAALGALAYLTDVRSGKAEVRFSCTDTTGSDLCRSPRTIRQELAGLPAWAVTTRGAATELWLGDRGRAVTAFRFTDRGSLEVTVHREIPAPF